MSKQQVLNGSYLAVGTFGLVALSCFASPANAGTINNVTNWQVFGSGSSSGNSVNLSTSNYDYNAGDIASFLGISPTQLEDVAAYTATGGSAAKAMINAKAGDILNFDWFFQAGDYLPFNDFSFWTISNTANLLADIVGVGNYGSTSGSQSYTFGTTGTYTLGFGVLDSTDTALDSYVSVSNVTTTSVPEPATVAGLLAVGTLLATTKKRKQQQKG